MEKPLTHIFPNKRTAQTIQVQRMDELSRALNELGIQYPCPTLVLIGGASGISENEMNNLRRLFRVALAPLVDALGIVVVDGGTDAGAMQLMGQARAEVDGTFPLIGVAAIGTIALSDAALARPDNELLEPHHSHFLLIPGSNWGDESSWIAQVAAEIAAEKPSLTLLVNGGEIAWDDLAKSVDAHRPVIVIKGSGRTADKLASVMAGDLVDERAQKLVESGLLQAIDLADGFEVLLKKMKAYFEGQS
jgi:SLOG in TRPM, prokaryote